MKEVGEGVRFGAKMRYSQRNLSKFGLLPSLIIIEAYAELYGCKSIMKNQEVNTLSLLGETLITLSDAAKDFGDISVPISTVRMYVYQGVQGLKLETISINGRYTSKEAIRRFIERKQNIGMPFEKPRVKPMTTAELEAGLRRHGLVK